MTKRSYPLLIAVLLLSMGPGITFAQVQARIRIIEASSTGGAVDPVLKDVHDQMGSLFNFTSYRLLKDFKVSLAGNRPVELPVHPGRALEVTLIGEYKKLIELRIRVKREGAQILNTHVRLNSGRTILIGGPKHGAGTIIFAISSRF